MHRVTGTAGVWPDVKGEEMMKAWTGVLLATAGVGLAVGTYLIARDPENREKIKKLYARTKDTATNKLPKAYRNARTAVNEAFAETSGPELSEIH